MKTSAGKLAAAAAALIRSQTTQIAALTGASAPQYLLTPALLTSVRAKHIAQTPQWLAFRARLDAELPRVTSPSYQGDELVWIADFALGYLVTGIADYADKAIALILCGARDNQRLYMGTQMFLARGDGVTIHFNLPHSSINADTMRVWLASAR